MEPPTPESEFARSLMDNAVNHFDLSTYKYVEQYPIICAHIVSMSSCAACPVTGARPAGLRLLDLPISLRSTCGNTWQLRATELACFYSKRQVSLVLKAVLTYAAGRSAVTLATWRGTLATSMACPVALLPSGCPPSGLRTSQPQTLSLLSRQAIVWS